MVTAEAERELVWQEMRKVAEGLGLDTSQLVRVQHEGCTYAGADVPLPASASQAIIA